MIGWFFFFVNVVYTFWILSYASFLLTFAPIGGVFLYLLGYIPVYGSTPWRLWGLLF